MSDSVFFVNVLPPNDRRMDSDYLASLDYSIHKSCELGFKQTLVTIGDKRYDPWVLAQYALQKNKNFRPLIASNPAQQYPVALLKRLISLKNIAQVPIALNLVTGSFISELASIGDALSFTDRNERLVEFLTICHDILHKSGAYSFKGKHYQLENVNLYPADTQQKTDFYISGSFENKLNLGENSVYYVKNFRPFEFMQKAQTSNSGLSMGICARATEAEAQTALKELYPVDRQGELLFSLALSNNETPWNIWLKEYLKNHPADEARFSLKPLQSYRSAVPFLVGSYETVAETLKQYMALNYKFFVLDFHSQDFDHIKVCMDLVRQSKN